jgi:hypothetical protein
MNESPVAREWRAQARRQGKIDALLVVLDARLGAVPKDLADSIWGSTDNDQLHRLLDSALSAQTIEDFRRDTGL